MVIFDNFYHAWPLQKPHAKTLRFHIKFLISLDGVGEFPWRIPYNLCAFPSGKNLLKIMMNIFRGTYWWFKNAKFLRNVLRISKLQKIEVLLLQRTKLPREDFSFEKKAYRWAEFHLSFISLPNGTYHSQFFYSHAILLGTRCPPWVQILTVSTSRGIWCFCDKFLQ